MYSGRCPTAKTDRQSNKGSSLRVGWAAPEDFVCSTQEPSQLTRRRLSVQPLDAENKGNLKYSYVRNNLIWINLLNPRSVE